MTTQNKTLIPYLDKIWTTVVGCSHCGPGCAHCFAEQWSYRLAQMGNKDYQGLHKCAFRLDGSGSFQLPNAPPEWNGVVRTLPHKLDQPFHWKKPRVVGVNFMADQFHDFVPDAFLCDILSVIHDCPRHVFFALTKRTARMRRFFQEFPNNLPNNLAIGVSCSSANDYDNLVPDLLATSAPCRILSAEPMILPFAAVNSKFNGVIVGCESGPNRRPMRHVWVRDLILYAREWGIPVYLKQICSNPDGSGKLLKDPVDIARAFGQCPRELPALLQNTLRKGPSVQ